MQDSFLALKIYLDLCQERGEVSIIEACSARDWRSACIHVQNVGNIVLYLDMGMGIPVQGEPDHIHLSTPDYPAVQIDVIVTAGDFPCPPARAAPLEILPGLYSIGRAVSHVIRF